VHQDRKEVSMDENRQIYGEQAARWNGDSGRAWVEQQELLDGMFKPLEDLLTGTVFAGDRVLDVGCGAGSTTLAAARVIGPKGRCVGIDISAPMLNAARTRAERENVRADFIHADAQTHAFGPGSFDTLLSRFGVMFFGDPVAAFANLRHAVRPDGKLHFMAWRSAGQNPFMTTAERAASPFVGNVPARPTEGPGQFAFADERRVRFILEESGWAGVTIRPLDVVCSLPRKDLVRFFTRLGPLGAIFHELDARTRDKVVETVRAAFEPFVRGEEVRFTAACWIVSARTPAAAALTSREATIV
jgi:SAM-dependent methyltransferase